MVAAQPPADDDERGRGRAFCRRLGWSHRDAVGVAVGAVAVIAILVNVLFLQSGPHPAPMFKSGVGLRRACRAGVSDCAAPTRASPAPHGRPLRRARPAEAPAPKPHPGRGSACNGATRSRGAARPSEIITDIQRELARRGFYDGAVDGRYGPKTDAAIRDFEQAAGLKPSAEPNEALLRAITARASSKRASAAGRVRRGRPRRAAARNDPIAEMLAPSKRVIAVQRALAEFGYGQIKPTGIVDPETQAAIEKFERERKLPVTGQISDRVARELAAITGRPLE